MEYRNLAKQLEIETNAASECRVTLSGSEGDFRFLDPGSVKVGPDLTNASVSVHEIQLSKKNIRLPANLLPDRIEPRTVRLDLQSHTNEPAPVSALSSPPVPVRD